MRRAHNDGLPAPEIEPADEIAEHPRLAQPLQRIVNAHEHPVADERENHRVGVQRADAPESDELEVQVRAGEKQFHGGQQAHQHADDAPDHGRDRKGAHDPVVIFECFDVHIFVLLIILLHHFCFFRSWLFFVTGAEAVLFPPVLESSSASIRSEGVNVSSYWPILTAQMKQPKKAKATARLARISTVA